jgi:hypothetical protein
VQYLAAPIVSRLSGKRPCGLGATNLGLDVIELDGEEHLCASDYFAKSFGPFTNSPPLHVLRDNGAPGFAAT